MRICINVLGLRPAYGGGIEIYIRNFLDYLSTQDKKNEYYIFLSNSEIRDAFSKYSKANIHIFYFPKYYTSIIAALLILFTDPVKLFKFAVNKISKFLFSKVIYSVNTEAEYKKIIGFERKKIDVVHFPFSTIDSCFQTINTPIVLTLHDIQQEYYPIFFDSETLYKRNRDYRASAHRADVIVTISESTKKNIVEKYGIPSEKIIVSYQGCSPDFKKIDDANLLNSVKEKYFLPDEFMLYPASTWPHKNHLNLLSSLKILNEKYNFKKILVLTGITKEHEKKIKSKISELNISDQVKFLNFVPFSDIPVIFNLASILVFPSLFEGFGIPLLEAMRTGLPVVCSNATSIPEVVGDAGIYFDPENPEDMAKKILLLWENQNLKDSCVEKGFRQAEKFTWNEAGRVTINAYEMAVKNKHGYDISK